MPELRLIDSHDLLLSLLNPRTVEPSEAEIAALAGSIAELGLLQNLIGLDRGDLIEIVGGGLRLRALQTLPPQEVDVLVYDDAAAAVAAALAENEVRREMTPLDKFRAYLALSERGHSLAQIARAYATDEAEVSRRLALRVCAPEVLEALGEGRLSVDQARAFTVTHDHARQVRVLAELRSWDRAPEIRSKLRNRDDATEIYKAQQFVGLEAYEAAGGTVTRDLFSDGAWIENPTLLFRLRDQLLKAAAEAEEAAGWSWAQVGGDGDGFAKLHPVPSSNPLTEEEGARYEELLDQDIGLLSEEERAEYRALQARSDRELEGVWSPDQMSVAGVIVQLRFDREVEYVRGLVRPEDEAQAVELGLLKAKGGLVSLPAAGDDVASPDTLSSQLVADLLGLRAIAVRNAVATSPELALDLLAWHLECGSSGLISINLTAGGVADGATLGIEPVDLESEKTAASFLAFRLKGKKHRNAVIAQGIARAFGAGWGSGAPLATEHVAAVAGVDMCKVWTPGEALFKRMKVGQLETLFQELTGHPVKAIYIKHSKADLVALLCDLFSDPAAMVDKLRKNFVEPAPDLSARVNAWLPAPLRPAEPHASGLAA